VKGSLVVEGGDWWVWFVGVFRSLGHLVDVVPEEQVGGCGLLFGWCGAESWVRLKVARGDGAEEAGEFEDGVRLLLRRVTRRM